MEWSISKLVPERGDLRICPSLEAQEYPVSTFTYIYQGTSSDLNSAALYSQRSIQRRISNSWKKLGFSISKLACLVIKSLS